MCLLSQQTHTSSYSYTQTQRHTITFMEDDYYSYTGQIHTLMECASRKTGGIRLLHDSIMSILNEYTSHFNLNLVSHSNWLYLTYIVLFTAKNLFSTPILAFCFHLKCLLILPVQRTMHSPTAGMCDKPQIQKPKQNNTHINSFNSIHTNTHSHNEQHFNLSSNRSRVTSTNTIL